MRFSTAVNVLLLGVATIVSALPVSQSTSSLELESRDDVGEALDMFERGYDDPATIDIYRRVYQIALHRSQAGTPHEHWSMHLHPNQADPNAHWHIVHAVSDPVHGHGVLQTEHAHMGGAQGHGYNPAFQGPDHHILGQVNSERDARAVAASLRGIRCQNQYPNHNCVDWTRTAVNHLHNTGHITQQGHQQFTQIYDQHQANVRAMTNTHEARVAAGLPY